MSEKTAAQTLLEQLTPREREVMELLRHDRPKPGKSEVAAVIMRLALCVLGGWFCWRIAKARLAGRSA